MQETLPQPFLQHFWFPRQLESDLHWSAQMPSMGIPGLTGGQVPGFSAKAKGHGLRLTALAQGAEPTQQRAWLWSLAVI